MTTSTGNGPLRREYTSGFVELVEKPAQPLTESQLWGDDAPLCVDISKCTPEEKALYEVWLDKLQLAAGAEESVRFAHISLRDAREAVQRAQYEFHKLVRRNAEAVREMETT